VEVTLSYTYHPTDKVQTIPSSNANGASASYTYDTLNRLSTVVDSRLGTTKYTYDPASNVATVIEADASGSLVVAGCPTLDPPLKFGCPILSTVSPWKGWETTNLGRALFTPPTA
jgi:YD repeat-containing protein